MAVSPRNGLKDWVAQRLTAIVMLVYLIGFLVVIGQHSHLDYITWRSIFNQNWVRFATLVFLAALAWHAWIGLWTVATDYIKLTLVRSIFLTAVFAALVVYLLWGMQILWGVI